MKVKYNNLARCLPNLPLVWSGESQEVHTLPSADVVIVDPPRKFGVPGMDVPGKVLGSKFRISGLFHPKKILSHLEAQDLFR